MIIPLTGQKGGVGKSTTAIGLAVAGLARGLPHGTARTWGDAGAEAGHPTPAVIAMGARMHGPDQLPTLSRAYDLTIIDCPPRHGDVQQSVLMVSHIAVSPCGPLAADAWAPTARAAGFRGAGAVLFLLSKR